MIRAVPDVLAVEVVEPRLPPPPDDLPEPAKAIWTALARELEPRGLQAADLESLRLLCVAAHRARAATEHVERYGMIVQGARGPMANPMIRVEKDATATYVRLAEQFGLTVAARLRLGVLHLMGRNLSQSLHASLEDG